MILMEYFDKLRDAKDFENLKVVFLEVHQLFVDGKMTYTDYKDLAQYFRHIVIERGWK